MASKQPLETQDCAYGAPFIVYPKSAGNREIWQMVRGNCHHWDCPRCGVNRAKQEYWKIINGVKMLHEKHGQLAFFTITCKGREMTKREAEKGYLLWTDRLNTSMRNNMRSRGLEMSYAAVTERQKRGHPHSHYLTTFWPTDAAPYTKLKVIKYRGRLRLEGTGQHYASWWIEGALERAGLGSIYDLSLVENPDAAARYVAKYLFKDSIRTKWPKGWKRVRYSQNWPENDQFTPDGRAFAIVKNEDWQRIAELRTVVRTGDELGYSMAIHRGVYNISLTKQDDLM